MSNCIGFIDGTAIVISRPRGNRMQSVVYSCHKRKHALKYKTIVTPRWCHSTCVWTFGRATSRLDSVLRSGMDENLCAVLSIDGKQYCIYGYSVYTQRMFLEVPFQSSNLTAAQKAFNDAMSFVPVTVEWLFIEIEFYWSAMDLKRKLRVRQSPVGLRKEI